MIEDKLLVVLNQINSLRKWQTMFLEFLKKQSISFTILEIGPETKSFLTNNVYKNILKLEKKLFKIKDDIFILDQDHKFESSQKHLIDMSGFSTIINLSDLPKKDLKLPRLRNGIWEFIFKKDGRHLHEMPIISELKDKDGYTPIQLIAHVGNEQRLLDQNSSTLHDLSIYININKLFQSVYILLKRNIQNRDALILKSKLLKTVPVRKTRRLNSFDFIKRITSFATAFINNKFIYNQWNIHISFNSNCENLKDFKIINCPKDRFWADPFYINHEGQHFVFVEELLRKDKVAHLTVLEIDKDANLLKQQVILKKDFHLSYPQVFKHLGEYYMIPESESNRSIDLYKSTSFPYKWEHELTLMEGVRAADATLFQKDNKWWLFANITEFEGTIINDELSLFYTDDIFNPDWKPHHQNPIVKDCRSARPAGKLFQKNNKLYRPSQNCSFIYGYGMNINEVEVLNEYEYKEKIVKTYFPNWMPNIMKNHTYNYFESGIVIDAMHKKSKLV